MSCENGQEQISLFLDRQIADQKRENVRAHIQSCRDCSSELESMQELRQSLRTLPEPIVPAALNARVMVIASHERQRRLVRQTVFTFARHCFSRVRLAFDNLMRPVALPFAGGSLSAVVLFSVLVPTLSFPRHLADAVLSTYPDGTVVVMGLSGSYAPGAMSFPDEAAAMKQLGDMPRIEPANAITPADANVVELTIDERGRVSDYSLERGHLTPDLQSIIMFSEFTPATVLGIPASAKIKIVQRRLQGRHLRS
jgi:hypothetical protein